ncbi:MAG: RNA polymerase sigma factor [bacterium]
MVKNLEELVNRIKNGDQKAFSEVLTMYQQTAYNLAFRILLDEEEARDTVQESFIKIWKKIGLYNPSQKFTTWMFRIVTNSAVDRYRALKRRNEVGLEVLSGKLEKICSGATDTVLDNKDLARLIGTLAGELPEKQRLVFILRDIQEMDSAEVQLILKLSENTIKSNLYHARKSIREKLENLIHFERRQS